MNNNTLKLFIIPLLSIVAYLTYTYLFSSFIGFDSSTNSRIFAPHFINPFTYILSFGSFYLFFSKLLPLLLVILLFVMQYSLLSMTKNNILYVLSIPLAVFSIMTILFSFVFSNIYLFFLDFTDYITSMLFLPVITWVSNILFIASIGFTSHFYFKLKNITPNPIKINPVVNQCLVAIVYSLLYLSTLFTYISYSLFKNPYTFSNSGELIFIIISTIIIFIYLYAWTYQHLKSHFNSDCYAVSTIKAYSITMLCNLIFSIISFAIMILVKNVFSYNIMYHLASFIENTYFILIIVFYIIAMILIVKLANKVENLFYTVFHYLLFGIITLVIIFFAIDNRAGIGQFLIIYGIIIFLMSISIWITYLFTKLALNKSFR